MWHAQHRSDQPKVVEEVGPESKPPAFDLLRGLERAQRTKILALTNFSSSCMEPIVGLKIQDMREQVSENIWGITLRCYVPARAHAGPQHAPQASTCQVQWSACSHMRKTDIDPRGYVLFFNGRLPKSQVDHDLTFRESFGQLLPCHVCHRSSLLGDTF